MQRSAAPGSPALPRNGLHRGRSGCRCQGNSWYAGKPGKSNLSFGLQGQSECFWAAPERANCTSEPRRGRSAGAPGRRGGLRLKPMRVPTRCREIGRTVSRLGRPALALAMCGDTARRRSSQRDFEAFSKWKRLEFRCNCLNSSCYRAPGDQPAKAVELWHSASLTRRLPGAVYLRGLAYLSLRDGVKAAAEFRKILDPRGASWGATWL